MLGRVELSGPDGCETGTVLAQPKRLALLTYLALSGPHGFLRRDSLVATFWPDLDDAHARSALSQALHFLRRELNQELFERRGEEEIKLAADALWCDAVQFDRSCGAGDFKAALRLYRGQLLDAFFIGDAPEFEHWLDGERARIDRGYAKALQAEAERLAEAGHAAESAECWRRRAECEPYNSAVTVNLMLALAATGNRAGAIGHAAAHAQRVAADLEVEADPAVARLAERLRRSGEAGAPSAESPLQSSSRAVAVAGRTARKWLLPALVVGGIGLAGLALRLREPAHSRRVAVSIFQDRTGDSAFARLGTIAAEWITQGLQQTGLVEVVPSETMLLSSIPSGGGPGRAPGGQMSEDLGRGTGAAFIVRGQVFLTDDSLRLRAEIVDVRKRRLVGAPLPVGVARDDEMRGIELLRQHVMGSLASVLDPRVASWAAASSNPPSLAALSEFTAGMDALARQGMPGIATDHFRRAAAADSSYVMPLLWMIDAYTRGGGFARHLADSVLRVVERSRGTLAPIDRLALDRFTAILENDPEGAYRASRALVALAPDSHFTEWLAADAYALNRHRETVALLTGLDHGQRWVRESQVHWATLAYALHDLGEYQQQLVVARRARASAPRLIRFVWLEAQALTALGRLPEVTRLIAEAETLPFDDAPREALAWHPGVLMRNLALELRAHGHPAMAHQILVRGHAWYAARPAAEQEQPVAIYNRMQRLEELEEWAEASATADTLSALGWSRAWARATIAKAAAARGDVAAARSEMELLVGPRGRPPTPEELYLGAQVAAMIGDPEKALELLRQSFARGRRHSFWAHLTVSFESLRKDERYRRLMLPSR